mmetsp:Transcript_40467/g.126142  ORF Transcript_40467/g.126142 Transcript_40467/m.126142 type:complete len:127 (+) Transcript_40467:100-480(+)
MARARSPLAVAILAVLGLGLAHCLFRSPAFLPTPAVAARAELATRPSAGQAATAVWLAAAAASPLPAMALEDEEEGFDLRILAVLALPLGAISWALFNVWRVAFRQVVRIGESTSGSSAAGLSAED